jgi:hypothetical protein
MNLLSTLKTNNLECDPQHSNSTQFNIMKKKLTMYRKNIDKTETQFKRDKHV